MTLSELVRVAGIRWSVEECLRAAKSRRGLDYYQVRHWTSWHRHVTLAMLALAFLTAVAASPAPKRPGQPATATPKLAAQRYATYSPPSSTHQP